MGQKNAHQDAKKTSSTKEKSSRLLGFPVTPYVDQCEQLSEDQFISTLMASNTASQDSPKEKGDGHGHGAVGVVWLAGTTQIKENLNSASEKILAEQLPAWSPVSSEADGSGRFECTTSFGWLWRLSTCLPLEGESTDLQHDGLFALTTYTHARDQIGAIVAQAEEKKLDHVIIYAGTNAEQLGALVGLEMSRYRFQKVYEPDKFPVTLRLSLVGFDKELIEKAGRLGWSTNLARHLVNLPASTLSPDTYCDFVEQLFADSKQTKITILRKKQLKEEGLELIQAVGRGAKEEPAIVRISYRPSKSLKGSATQPVVFVGKGITFDTGGLDIKPSSGMRNMKKDMGGSASVVGIAAYVDRMQLSLPCDFYLAVAENAVSGKSFKPGDIIKTANGMSVEIHNTDAEGRLVLADALIYSLKQEAKPAALVDIATLTGAMRVAVGTKLAGLFSNQDDLAQSILHVGQEFGDPCWRMPLYDDYWSQMRSSVADFSNASASSFGGSITAALFLKKFVTPGVKWAHLDLYAWTDQASGCLLETGGNGHAVQLFAHWLERR